MSKKEVYREFCKVEKTVPIFSRAWWLDAVSGENNWDVTLVTKDGNVVASMPYCIKYKYGLTIISHPPLTQTLGPWLKSSHAKYAKVLAEQKDVMLALIAQLPAYDSFLQKWSYQVTNWLPFYWSGFKQTTRYTYILPNLSDEKFLWSELQAKIRTDIRKAENRYNLKVRDDLSIDDFLELNKLTFERQGMSLPYSEDLVRRLDDACVANQCRKIWIAEDSEGRHHAGVYIVWDENCAYYIMGGANPDLRNSGATSFCMWHAIRHAASVTQKFDFEGSMLESVERFVRSFGAIQTSYFSISNTPSRILRIRDFVKNFMKNS